MVFYGEYDIMGVITMDGKEYGCHTPGKYGMLWYARTPVGTPCLLTLRYISILVIIMRDTAGGVGYNVPVVIWMVA